MHDLTIISPVLKSCTNNGDGKDWWEMLQKMQPEIEKKLSVHKVAQKKDAIKITNDPNCTNDWQKEGHWHCRRHQRTDSSSIRTDHSFELFSLVYHQLSPCITLGY
ncbi:Sodium/potassium/calcium exchanger [Dirofilaria immitis]